MLHPSYTEIMEKGFGTFTYINKKIIQLEKRNFIKGCATNSGK